MDFIQRFSYPIGIFRLFKCFVLSNNIHKNSDQLEKINK